VQHALVEALMVAPGATDALTALQRLLAALALEAPWKADAACPEHPEVEFFPRKGEPAAPAKVVCAWLPGAPGVSRVRRRARPGRRRVGRDDADGAPGAAPSDQGGVTQP
jgi:hypothetical protein